MKSKIIIYTFWVLCVADILANAISWTVLDWTVLHWAIKPLLMPCLAYLFIYATNNSKENSSRLMITGLLFCWLGDVLLMFEKINSIFFIFGLASFLCGHIFYILYFSRLPCESKKIPVKKILMLLPVAIYVVVLLYILYPSLGDLKIPVIVYAIVIGVMLGSALWQGQKIDSKISLYFITGAISFVVSDSLLAINKFYQPFSLAGFFIMLTYCIAQYLIVIGGIKMYKEKAAFPSLVG